MITTPPLTQPQWRAHRIIPSCFPPVGVFERYYDSARDLDLAFEIESMTNDRLLDDAGDLQLVAPEDRVWGPGSTPIMAAFTHLGFGSRFATDTFGAYYAASTLETAIAETVYHKERELAAANEESIDLTMRCYVNEVSTPLHDIRGPEFEHLHNPSVSQYGRCQAYAAALRAESSWGLVYNSVRHPGGECIAAFKPKAVTIPVQSDHLMYFYDGEARRITHWTKVTEAHQL